MTQKPSRTWSLILFGLPFACVGLGFFVFGVLPNLYEWQQMKSWHEVRAQLQHAELISHRGSDSTTYRAAARYSYDYGGQHYVSERVALMGSADNIGSFQQDLAAELQRAHRAGRGVPAWVNPKDPADAVLNRDMRWPMLAVKSVFAVTFSLVGLGLVAWGWVGHQQQKHPDGDRSPWLNRRDWADNRIGCATRGGLWFVWGFALIWNIMTSFLWWVIPDEFSKGNTLILVAALFPLVGLGLLGWAIQETRQWRRFGPVELVLDPFPGSIGGQVGGQLDLALRYDPELCFALTLSCLRSRVTGSGKQRRRSESLRWQTQGYAYPEPTTEGTRLNFCFDVPADLPASEPSSDDYHLWRLELSSKMPGVDLNRRFEVPVYTTGEKSRGQKRLSTEHPAAAQQRMARIESVLDIQSISGGVELYFPILRDWLAPLLLLGFGAVFGGAGLALRHAKDAPGPLIVIFCAVGGLMSFFSVKSLFASLRVQITRDGIVSQGYWLGLPLRLHQVPRDQVARLVVETAYTRQTGSRHTEVCRIRAHTRDGRKILIAKRLQGRDTAEQVLETLGTLTGYAIR